jgi:hypothetical protein
MEDYQSQAKSKGKALAKEAALNATGLKAVAVAYKYKKFIIIGVSILVLMVVMFFVNITSTANPIEGFEKLSEVCPDVVGTGMDYVFGNAESAAQNCAEGYATQHFAERAQ